MLLLQSWKESCNVCKPHNLKLLGLVTIKSAAQAYITLISYFWWLLLLLVSLQLSCHYLSDCLLQDPNHYVIISLKMVLVMCMFIIARPSGGLKNMTYMYKYGLKIVPIGFLCAFILMHISQNMFWFVSIICACAILFYLDSYGRVTDLIMSFVRGLLMVVYNAPVCLLCILVCMACLKLLHVAVGTYSTELAFFLLPCMLAFIKNIYVKRLHDQFNLYYGL